MPHWTKWDLLELAQITVSLCSSEMMFALFSLFLSMISPWHASLPLSWTKQSKNWPHTSNSMTLVQLHISWVLKWKGTVQIVEFTSPKGSTLLTGLTSMDCPMQTLFLIQSKLSTSMAPQSEDDVAFMKSVPYINAVGSLMYLAITSRPDIAYSVGVLARFNSNPGPLHWKAVKHLLRYCKGTMDLKLVYGPGNSDADHGGNSDNGRSTGGYLVKIGSGAVSWSSKLQ